MANVVEACFFLMKTRNKRNILKSITWKAQLKLLNNLCTFIVYFTLSHKSTKFNPHVHLVISQLTIQVNRKSYKKVFFYFTSSSCNQSDFMNLLLLLFIVDVVAVKMTMLLIYFPSCVVKFYRAQILKNVIVLCYDKISL